MKSALNHTSTQREMESYFEFLEFLINTFQPTRNSLIAQKLSFPVLHDQRNSNADVLMSHSMVGTNMTHFKSSVHLYFFLFFSEFSLKISKKSKLLVSENGKLKYIH